MNDTKRISHFDLLKVIAMLFVCISHVFQRVVPNGTTSIIFGVFYSVHMSIFIFVGAYFVRRCTTIKDLLKYFLKMLICYVLPAIIFTILTVISMARYSNHDVVYWLNEFLVRTDTFYWYAIAAFVINAFLATSYYISSKIIKIESLKKDVFKNIVILICFAILFIPFILIHKSETPGLLATNLIVEFVPLAIMGFLFRSFGKYIKQNKVSTILELLVAGICLILYVIALINFKGWLNKATTILLILHQLGSICGVYVYYVLTKWLCKLHQVSKLSIYGKYSYPLYLVHVYIIRVITPYVSKITEVNFYSISFVVLYSLVFTFGSLVITLFLTKNKYINLILFGDYSKLKKKDSKSFDNPVEPIEGVKH